MKKTNLIIIGLMVMGFVAGTEIAQADDFNLAGRWVLTLIESKRVVYPELLLTQEGNSLTGTYKGTQGDSPLTGTVNGDSFEILYTARGQQVITTGTVAGNKMSGMMNFNSFMLVDFTGEKQ